MSGSERLDPNPGVTIGGSGAHAVGDGYTSDADPMGVADQSVGEIVGRLASDFSRLMRAEIALAKAEAKEEVKDAGKGVGMLAGAGYAGHLLVLFLSLALMFRPRRLDAVGMGGAHRRRDLGDRRVRPVLLRPQEPQARHAPHGRDRRDLEGGRPMGEETARLRAEIDQTRDDLTRDVDLLAEKTSPSKIVERRVQSTKRGITGLKDKVMGTFGSDDDEYGYESSSGYSGGGGVGGAASSAKDSVTGAASSAKDSVTGAAQGAVSTVSGAASGAASSVSGAASSVGDAASGAVGQARQQAEGNPLAAGLVAFGVGWLVSSLLPASEAEQRAARRAVETAKDQGVVDQAKQVAQDVGSHMQEQAQQAAQQVKDKAQDATETVKQEAQSATQDVKQTAAGAAQDVRDETQQHVEAVRSGSGSSSGSDGYTTTTY